MPAHPDLEIFADGINSVWVRSGVLKIDLYQSVAISADAKGEFRRLSQRVSLPLSAISELKDFIQKIETAMGGGKG